MAVYNGEAFVHRAIESILNQTFSDFELIIINDGSTDKTNKILQSYKQKDKRIRILNQSNTGLTIALNNGIQVAKGSYIARLDADDVALPYRFDLQHSRMDQNKDIVLCGSNCINVSTNGTRTKWGYEGEASLNKSIFYKTPFAHSTALIRKNALDNVGVYNYKYKTSQDAELWMRLAKYGRIIMIKDPLVERYIFNHSISRTQRWRQFYDALKARVYHAPGHKKIFAIIYSFRSLCIGLIPTPIIHYIKQIQH